MQDILCGTQIPTVQVTRTRTQKQTKLVGEISSDVNEISLRAYYAYKVQIFPLNQA
jgi:ACT domain-containing protein